MPPAPDLPLPVATLLRRARNAKSPKDRHDTAYFAWEVSVRLAVAARPPADVSPLARGSVGQWVRALTLRDEPLDDEPLLSVLGLLSEIGAGKKATPRSVTPRKLLDALPAYRNQVVGHGATRSAEFYDGAGARLLDGLVAAWSTELFLRRDAQLVYVEAVELDPEGARRARLLSLSGLMSHVLDPRGTLGVREDVLPGRVYLRRGDEYRDLHPWVLCELGELCERVLFFNGIGRRAQYLDYASGEALRGAALEKVFPGVEAAVFALFSREQSDEQEPEPQDPDLFGDYRILGKLGEGGMGVVYLARQESLDRLVALKMLPAHATQNTVAVARFHREVAALGRCEHPNVIKILASGTALGTPYYAMEYVEGADLGRIYDALSSSDDFDSAVSTAAEAVRTEKRELFENVPSVPRGTVHTTGRPQDRARALALAFRDAARGVHCLHESGVIHRDLKPANLMITAADHRVVVMDLGLAAVADASRSITRDKGQILGTLRYMPPEQLQRNLLAVDHRADVYALGATFYELLCERAFFDGDTEARLIEQVLRQHPVPANKANPRLPADLGTILRKSSEKDPKLRYDSAAALADDLDRYLDGRPIAARPPTLGYLLRLAIRRNRALAATLAAAFVVVVGLVAFFMGSLADEGNRANRALDDVRRLSDAKQLADLMAGAEDLWPVDPARVSAARAWITRAETLLERLPQHRRALAELRARAQPYTEEARRADHAPTRARIAEVEKERKRVIATLEGIAEDGSDERSAEIDGLTRSAAVLAQQKARLEASLQDRLSWEFEDGQLEWEHEIRAELVTALEGLVDEQYALLPAVRLLVDFTSTLEQATVHDHADAWKRALAAIADTSRNPQYGGLQMPPQVGLVPLGQDPGSRLFEFAMLGSGSVPKRDGGTGALRREVDCAIVFVLIPGGTFHMGSQATDSDAANHDPAATANEGPVHEVTLPAFFIAKYEMTQAQYENLTLGEQPAGLAAGLRIGGKALTADHPVEMVSWHDCDLWLWRWRLSLPTEEQWEYACRAGTSTPWGCGATVGSLQDHANIADRCLLERGSSDVPVCSPEVDDKYVLHAPTGSFRPNAYGLHDMHGNVKEWCRSTIGKYTAERRVDPQTTLPTTFRATRGGGYWDRAEEARCAHRDFINAGVRDDDLGFRATRVLELESR